MKFNDKTVLVLGAGFTKAFLEKAPLLTDDYGAETIIEKFNQFPYAKKILENEVNRNENGEINIERLMTRLENPMPYEESLPELDMLNQEIKIALIKKIEDARPDISNQSELEKIAKTCVENSTNCITFNYDDLFDQALWEVKKEATRSEKYKYWHPDSGYGFYCQPSRSTIGVNSYLMHNQTTLLLKMHGSLSWRIQKGHKNPYPISSILHHEDWLKYPDHISPIINISAIENHMESESFIVPPILSKSIFKKEPILRIVWSKAFEKLNEAKEVIFIGYSLPKTDIAAEFLFSEGINKEAKITVVNIHQNNDVLEKTYNEVLPNQDIEFHFDGAVNWIKEEL